LPLLAFALQRLWGQFAGSGSLTHDHYDTLGGLKGLIEDAAERALRGFEPEQESVMPSTPPAKRLIDLGAATFVPALAQLNHQGAIIRREAPWTSFDEEQQDLLHRFERWRLVVRKGEGAASIVEVAHEALFREWTRLMRWLEPERARLDALRLLQIDAANWDRNSRGTTFLNHRGKRLGDADALAANDNYRKRIGDAELAYLAACRGAARSARGRVVAVTSLLGVLTLALAGGVTAWSQGPWLKRQAYWAMHVRALSAADERALQPGDPPLRECTHCPAMVVLRANSFTMGSPDNARERPPHRVTIAQPFAVGQFEVTFDEWDACIAHGGACAPDVGTAGWGRGRQPVIFISWEQARHYVRWLSEVTGRTYRLLTEAEWEYAARAGNQANYSFGPDEASLGQYAWFADNAEGRAHSADDQKRPNGFGLYSMYGNVAEWVEDCFSEDYREPRSNAEAWTAGNCSRRVLRGGSFVERARALRSASRDWAAFDKADKTIGFRVARTLAR
jgi:formylglycine-generating enzyme required for sulfatase activity